MLRKHLGQLASQGICLVIHIFSPPPLPLPVSHLLPAFLYTVSLSLRRRGYYIPPVTTYLPLLWGNVGAGFLAAEMLPK